MAKKSLKKYTVRVVREIRESAEVEVEARSEAEAEAIGLEDVNEWLDSDWTYESMIDQTVKVREGSE